MPRESVAPAPVRGFRFVTSLTPPPVGCQPCVAPLACLRGSPCLNRPAMIDASRIGGPSAGPGLSHSHILDARAGGWFHTVNIRVLSAAAWSEIAEAKTLAKVRE